MRSLRYLPTILVKWLVRLSFLLFSALFKIKEKKVTFASYRDTELKGNLACIHQEFRDKYPEYEAAFLFKKLSTTKLGKASYLLHMMKASYHLATSRFFIIDDYYFPVYAIKPRSGTDIVQLWHAAGAFKKFGLSTIDKSFGPSATYLKHLKIHSNYTKVYVSSAEVVPHYAEAFDMTEKNIFPLGIPRTDYFFKDNIHKELTSRFFERYPSLMGKKLMLYAPTFRGKSHYQGHFKLPLDFSEMQEELGDGYALIVHLHPYMRGNVETQGKLEGFVCHIQGEFTIEELLVLSDILITDYSSVIFDYSLLCRPIAFIADDLEDYKAERDFYYEFESFIPGPFYTATKPLSQWIKAGEFDLEKVIRFRDRFFDYHDGKSSSRIVRHLIEQDSFGSSD
ncbi:CDP-glycerol glycerophosphotransferase family protein [Bacillus sp. EB01]|uniref:CDP-glycerol glycerophosphotransferase family protein n=1 Tax=Bacillus sp. EB01 TaxID=1347086 RepID=UPI0005C70641|nr:CDP-glycerol glycerophosphotransferase family protein [Bacillus sp. EB01]